MSRRQLYRKKGMVCSKERVSHAPRSFEPTRESGPPNERNNRYQGWGFSSFSPAREGIMGGKDDYPTNPDPSDSEPEIDEESEENEEN